MNIYGLKKQRKECRFKIREENKKSRWDIDHDKIEYLKDKIKRLDYRIEQLKKKKPKQKRAFRRRKQ